MGHLLSRCGFMDGEKIICMDNLYQGITNGSCLVYSFGLSGDWDFEVNMANLGMYWKLFSLNPAPRFQDSKVPRIYTVSQYQLHFFNSLTIDKSLRL